LGGVGSPFGSRHTDDMRITALSGGIGGARFLRGLRSIGRPDDAITVVGNTADDIWMFGLKICPDLDTVMYTLGGGIDEERGWGRTDETWRAKEELAAYGVEPTWFGLGDRDLATHVVRTQMLTAGYSLSSVTDALCARWLPPSDRPTVRLLPMSDDRVETHIVVDDADAPAGRRAIHFQEYWVRLHAEPAVRDVVVVGIDEATAAPGVVDAILNADVVLLPPSNPIVSIGTILGVSDIAGAMRDTKAPVVGLSPIVAGAAVRGMADQLLAGLQVENSAAGVAERYGARSRDGFIDGWLVHDTDKDQLPRLAAAGIEARAVPLLMRDLGATAAMATAALELASEIRR
jgi:LPPG:FO 2-phospho-L-lactate transferase